MRPRLPLHIPPLLPSFTVVRHLFLCRRFPGLVRQAVWAIFPFKSEFSLSKSAARRRLHYIVPSRLMAARNTSQTRAGKLNGTWHVLSVFRVFLRLFGWALEGMSLMEHPVLETAWHGGPSSEQNVENPATRKRRRQRWRHETERNMLLAPPLVSPYSSSTKEFHT